MERRGFREDARPVVCTIPCQSAGAGVHVLVSKCSSCGKNSPSFYHIKFSFTSKPKGIRYRKRNRQAFFCDECFEKMPTLPVEMEGERFFVSTKQRAGEEWMRCLRCGRKTFSVYSVLGCARVNEITLSDFPPLPSFCTPADRHSTREFQPLASVCAACGEHKALEIK
jgi:ribosomal protein L37E